VADQGTCRVCGEGITARTGPGRQAHFCSDTCRAVGRTAAAKAGRPTGEVVVPGRIPACQRGTCAGCGKDVYLSKTSFPSPRCLACRRAAYGLNADQRVNDYKRQSKPRGPCKECDGQIRVEPGSRRWKFCSDDCHRRWRNRRGSGAKKDTLARGYGPEHQRLRRELLPHAYDTPCCLCGDLMLVGQKLHLDHTEDRTDYRGFAHAECNVREGARRGAEALRVKRLTEGRRMPRAS
jgi:hypothetical protein